MKTLALLAIAFSLTGCPSITLPKVETQFCYYDENGQLCVGGTKDGNVAVTGGFKKAEEK